jgi:glycosyltransferase involved in cell wall biosynthesis
MLMIGYNTIDEAVDKGILSYGDERSIELHFNFNKSFEKILYTVPFGRHEKQKNLTDTIDYKEFEFRRGSSGLFTLINGLLSIPRALRNIRRQIERFNPDVIQINGPNIPSALAIMSRTVRSYPTVCFIEAYWETILKDQKNIPSLIRLFLPLWYRLVYKVFTCYSGTPSLNKEFYIKRGMDPERIAPWIQPFDYRQMDQADIKNAPADVLRANGPRILFIGRLHPEKLGLDALRIFAKAVRKDLLGTLIFVGDGDERQRIEQESKSLGIHERVVITGMLEHKEVMATMKAADYSIATMQGSALLESLAAGLATVGYDHETHRALIRDKENGFLVPHRDVDGAARVLREMLFSEPLTTEIRANALSFVEERFNYSKVKSILYQPFVKAMNANGKNKKNGAW